jgi:dCTP deaminase
MVLSNVEIHKAFDDGRLIIDPEPSPRKPTADNPDCPYDTTSVDLRLGYTLSIPRSGAYCYDLTQPGIAKFLSQNSDEVKIDLKGGYKLGPREFVLGKTLEHVSIPIRENTPALAGRVEGKSSFARCGLLVHFTAPTIHAGFEGTLTLEIIILGNTGIVFMPGMKICQLILEEVSGTPFPNPSQFQGQSKPSGTKS